MTAMNIGEAAGLAIGALVGGYIPMLWETYFKHANKYNGNLAFQMFFIFVLLIFTIFSTKDNRTGAKNNIRMADFVKESVSFVRANKIIKLLLVSVVFWGMTFSSIELYWQPHIKTILGSDQKTWIFGLLSSGYFMAAVVGSIVISFILSKYKRSYYSLLGWLRLIVAIFVIILSYQKTINAFAVIYLIMFMFNGMSSPPQSTVFNLEIPNDKRSSLLSLESLFMQLGGVIGSAVCGVIIMHTSIPIVWISAGILYAISSILFFYISRRKNRASGSDQANSLNYNRNR
jgi:predicted MFS family arabinose efflux permease